MWLTTPSFDPAAGSEIRKTRPAVIVSNDAANRNLARAVVVPVTSNTGRQYPGEAIVTVGGQSSKGSSSFRVEPNSHNDSWSSSPVGMCAGRWPACAHVHEACLIRRMSPWALP